MGRERPRPRIAKAARGPTAGSLTPHVSVSLSGGAPVGWRRICSQDRARRSANVPGRIPPRTVPKRRRSFPAYGGRLPAQMSSRSRCCRRRGRCRQSVVDADNFVVRTLLDFATARPFAADCDLRWLHREFDASRRSDVIHDLELVLTDRPRRVELHVRALSNGHAHRREAFWPLQDRGEESVSSSRDRTAVAL